MAQYRTPLRYPGGKQKLSPFIVDILLFNDMVGCHYVEPYAGGAGVAMELLAEGTVEHVHLNDASHHIYCFWHSVVNYPELFCSLISRCDLSIDEWRRQREIYRNPTKHSSIEVGFSTFYLNRTNRSGILSGGVIGGLAQDGKWRMDARFSRAELIKRVELIGLLSGRISLYNLDAEQFFNQEVSGLPCNTLMYIDPPYFNKADRLYSNHYQQSDHERIAAHVKAIKRVKWLVSYDGVDEILAAYSGLNGFVYQLQYNAARSYKGSEVFVFSNDLSIPSRSRLGFIDEVLSKGGELYLRAA